MPDCDNIGASPPPEEEELEPPEEELLLEELEPPPEDELLEELDDELELEELPFTGGIVSGEPPPPQAVNNTDIAIAARPGKSLYCMDLPIFRS
ncbi:hypothetical protein [uncultured Microbulbifer sp.]|uniref:hypothetical protein n=1 Tax=uncultured Microbulbifer sp. TaxID=348147 RepID=UPI0025FFC2A5|nr:hypothetical protein [uncultured Microbulbifer sp.]